MSDDATFPSLSLPAREIPSPKTVSPEAQAYLGAMASAPRGAYVASAPEAWRAVAAGGNQVMAAHAAKTGACFKGRIDRHEWDGVTVYEITPDEIGPDAAGRALFYVHGGAYLFGGGEIAATMALEHAQAAACKVFSTDYRMPPDHPYPAAIEDVCLAYRCVIERYDAQKVGVVGLSAGGGLAAALVLKIRDEAGPLPGALVLLSPEADLTEAGDSFRAGAFPTTFTPINVMYAAGADLSHPYLSPVFGDFSKGYPPTLIQSGTRDFFLSTCALLHRKLLKAGVPAELHVWEAMPHGGFGGLSPEDQDVLQQELTFLDRHLG